MQIPHSRSTLLRLAVPLALVVAYGCRCGPPPVSRTQPEFTVDPGALSFVTCPQLDGAGMPVADVFPDQKVLSLSNLGRASGTVTTSIDGPQKDEFSVVEAPADLPPNGLASLPIRFAPKKAGDSSATLTIDDGSPDTEPLTVTLQGTGRTLPATPQLELSYQETVGGTEFHTCSQDLGCKQQLDYPVTFYDQESTLKLRLKNTGCPALKFTGISISEHPASPSRVDYVIDAPATLPTPTAPTLLTATGGNNQLEIAVRFAPQRSQMGDDQRYAILTITTNDPTTPQFQMTLTGSGSEPAIYVTPTYCDFSEDLDTCGNTTKVPGKAKLLLKNSGTSSVTIDSALLEKSGQGRFSLVESPKGRSIEPGAELPVEVSYADGVTLVNERLVFSASAGGIPAGDAVVVLRGGIAPAIETEPASQIDFSGATTQVSTKTLLIKNRPGKGTLTINRVYVDDPTYFKVLTQVPAGTTVAAGASIPVEVQFTKPAHGGVQTSTLHIESNDPSVAAPNYTAINLYSQAPQDPAPTAVIKGCLPSDTTCANGKETVLTVRLEDLGMPKQVRIWGNDSYDAVVSGMPKKASKFQFRLTASPPNANTAVISLENDRMQTANGSVMLNVDPSVGGEYQVTLKVWDDVDQVSPNTALLRVVVQ